MSPISFTSPFPFFSMSTSFRNYELIRRRLVREVFEVESSKDKIIKIIVVEAECPIDWGLKTKRLTITRMMSKQYTKMMEKFIKKIKPNFSVDKLDFQSKYRLKTEKSIIKSNQQRQVPNKIIKTLENDKNNSQMSVKGLGWLQDIDFIIRHELQASKQSEYFMNLYSWYYCHKEEKYESEKELINGIWFIIGLLDEVKPMDIDKVRLYLITNQTHFKEMKDYFNNLNIENEEQILTNSFYKDKMELSEQIELNRY